MEHLTLEQATAFFSEFYYGEHHIPGYKPKEYGHGFTVVHDRGYLATYDYDQLTRLVFMAHRDCIRVSVDGVKKNAVRISIWKRDPESTSMSMRHPTIEKAMTKFFQP